MAPKIELHQFAFNGGELHPAMHARSDLEKYAVGAERIRNMVPRPYGGVHKRTGTHCIGGTLGNRSSRLVEFEFNAEQRYMLEFGEYAMRIISDDEFVAYPRGHAREGEIVVVGTPYSLAEAREFDYDQNADLMIIAHRRHPVRNLIREDHHVWRFRDHDFQRNILPPSGLRIVSDGRNGAKYCVTALRGEETSLGSNEAACRLAGEDEYLGVPNAGELSLSQLQGMWVDDYGNVIGAENEYGQLWPHEWIWVRWLNLRMSGTPKSALAWSDWNLGSMRLLAGEWFPKYIGALSGRHIAAREPVVLTGPDGTTAAFVMSDPGSTAAFSNFVQAVVMNGGATGYHGTLYGEPLISLARRLVLDYVDGENAKAAPTGRTELAWTASEHATSYHVHRHGECVNGEGAAVKGYFYIGTAAGTGFVDDNLPMDAALGLPVAGEDGENPFDRPGRYPGVCAFFEQRAVFGSTEEKPSSFWGSQVRVYNNFDAHSPVQADDSYAYTLNSKQVNRLDWMAPMDVLLIGTSSNEWKAGGTAGALTPLNPDVRIQSWRGCAPIRPAIVGRSVVFAGKSRRVLRDLSYSLESDGFDGNDLALYARHLFENRRIAGFCHQREPDSILWVVMDDGALLSCAYLPEQRVVSWSRHDTRGRFESANALADAGGEDRVYFVVSREVDGRTVRFIEVMKDPLAAGDDLKEAFYVDCGLSYRGTATASISGLDHLEGMEVDVLADGHRRAARVENGRIELGHPAEVVHAGLGYVCELDTLDLQPLQQPVKNRSARALAAVEAHFHKSVECRAGQTGGKAYEIFRAKGDGTPEPWTGKLRFHPAAATEANAYRLHFEMDAPYPLAILAVSAVGEVSA